MKLHHVTSRESAVSIAENGFRDGYRSHAAGVFLSPPGLLWVAGGMKVLDTFEALGGDEVVFAFDIPDEVAAAFAVREEVPAGDPADPEEALDLPFERHADGTVLYEYCVPAEVADRHCIGLVHWTESPPLTEGHLAALLSRRGRGAP